MVQYVVSVTGLLLYVHNLNDGDDSSSESEEYFQGFPLLPRSGVLMNELNMSLHALMKVIQCDTLTA